MAVFEMTAGDTAPGLEFELFGGALDAGVDAVAVSMWPLAAGALVIDSAEGEVIAGRDVPTLGYSWGAGETNLAPGYYRVAFRVTFTGGAVQHFRPPVGDLVSVLAVPG